MRSLVWISLFFVVQLAAQDGHALLWKIEGNGLSKPSFIYGTYHQVCPQHFQPSIATKEALKFVDEIHFEIHMDSLRYGVFGLGDEEGLFDRNNFPDYAAMSDSVRTLLDSKADFDTKIESKRHQAIIDSLFSLEEKTAYKKKLKQRLNLGFTDYHTFTLSMFIRGAQFNQRGCDIEDMVDYEPALYSLPESANKPQFGLANRKEHFSYFKYLNRDFLQLAYSAKQVLNHDKALFKAFKTDEAYFLAGKIHQLRKDTFGRLLNEPISEKAVNTALIDERNLLWIPRIINRIHHKSVFYGVGASHLGGELGLINLLRKKGYTVTACLRFKA
jgi:uncharacterized protein